MKFIIKCPARDSIYSLMREVGYHFLNEDREKRELNFVHPLEKGGYPRFHLYLKFNGDNLIFNLHLDQKRPSYKGAPAHSGEYEGKVIGEEVERIKKIINKNRR